MTDRPIPTSLPNCDLINILTEKAAQRNDIKFDFIGKLNDFRERVSGEVRQINLLFPEYTPHDEEYHLSRLFHVASLVLGRDRLEAMNSAELFILAISLYGHDWGMAVSELEKEYILNSHKSANFTDLWILPDEKSRLSIFLKNRGLKLDNSQKEVSIEIWREYVRQTHAFRSGERVRRFFEEIDGGVADAASRVCEGHWLDFEELDEYHRYPPDFSVLRETVNLRALAVYLRLIDLLDLSEDRTPYIIWKFVAPRDLRSRMEWAKHRALRPITCPPYQQGRIIQVDGSTDDHEVYAALEDLRNWCEQQLRGCNDILARMNDSRHKLDIYHIDWRVTARGFKPILIQFEFDRERMFEILGDEIYQSDSYVFLRELLQNSIDAIRVRREVLKRNGIAPGDIGTIRVDVEHGQNGDAIITWEDDGIGMDDYIIRNYFAVAGKSYYRSTDFEKEGLNIDPISRFGIGFLSCFMVADHVEIKTFKDPYLPPFSEPLHISIPAMHRQFRIETESRESAVPGTKIKVFVDGRKLKNIEHLAVTSYLSEVAGFVQFPILIHEDESKTILVHPGQRPLDVATRFGTAYTIRQIDQSLLLADNILPQDLPLAQKFLQEISFDISKDLKLDGYEGTLAYIVPKDDLINTRVSSRNELIVTLRDGREYEVRFGSISSSSYYQTGPVKSKSANHALDFKVYRDGILLSNASKKENRFSNRIDLERTIIPSGKKITVNLPKSKATKIDLARTEILDEKEHWSIPITNSLLKSFKLNDFIEMEPVDRLYKLSWMAAFYDLSIGDLWANFPHERWPIAILQNLMTNKLLEYKDAVGPIRKWAGKPGAIFRRSDSYSNTRRGIPGFAISIVSYPILHTYINSEVQFLTPPYDGLPPLVQEIWIPVEARNSPPDLHALLEQVSSRSTHITALELEYLNRKFFRLQRSVYGILWNIKQFSSTHRDAFAYSFTYLNISHAITQAIIKCAIALQLAVENQALEPEKIGRIQDAFLELNGIGITQYLGSLRVQKYKEFSKNLSSLFSLTRDYGVVDINPRGLVPKPDEFIKGTIRDLEGKIELVEYDEMPSETIYGKTKSFGKLIKG